MVCAAPDMAYCSVVQWPKTARRGIRFGSRKRLPQPLTGLGAWASVATLAGIMR